MTPEQIALWGFLAMLGVLLFLLGWLMARRGEDVRRLEAHRAEERRFWAQVRSRYPDTTAATTAWREAVSRQEEID